MANNPTTSRSVSSTLFDPSTNFSFFQRFVILPEVNKTTISIFGSTEAVKKEIKKASEQESWVIHPYSAFRKYWLIIVILATFGNVIFIPMSVSFFTEEIHYSPEWISLNAIVDVLFVLDLMINFRIGYWSDENADVILDLVKIKNAYLKSWFVPDLVAVMPVDYIILICEAFGLDVDADGSGIAGVRVVKLIKLTRLFSLLRLLRFSRLLRYAQNWEEVHGWNVGGIATILQFLHMVVVIILICHWSACFHFMVAAIDDFPPDSWVTKEGLQNFTMSRQYTTCMFRSLCHMMALNYGSKSVPKGVTQLWVDIISMMVGTVIYALLLGRITALVTHSRASEVVYKSKYNELCQYVRQYRLPADLRKRCLDHLVSRYQGKWFDENAILMELNEPLRREIKNYNCIHLLEKHPIFANANPLLIAELLDMLEFEYYMTGEIIIQQGAIGDCMYFIERGEVLVEGHDFSQVLSDGAFFGELAMVTETNRRQAHVKALTPCRLYSLSVENYHTVLERFPEIHKGIDSVAQERLKALTE